MLPTSTYSMSNHNTRTQLMSNIYSIYKATNTINGKVYIGFDSNWPNRQKSHKYLTHKRNQNFYYAIRKYGWDNFIWEVLYQSKDGEYTLKIMESYFIKQYDSYNNGYNETLGGEGTFGWRPPKEWKEKQSKLHKGKSKPQGFGEKISFHRKGTKLSDDTKSKISSNHHNVSGENNPMYKKLHTEKTKQTIKYKNSLGLYITPWGNFISSTDAVSHPDSTTKRKGTLQNWCINNNLKYPKTLKNKTPKELGFFFIPK